MMFLSRDDYCPGHYDFLRKLVWWISIASEDYCTTCKT